MDNILDIFEKHVNISFIDKLNFISNSYSKVNKEEKMFIKEFFKSIIKIKLNKLSNKIDKSEYLFKLLYQISSLEDYQYEDYDNEEFDMIKKYNDNGEQKNVIEYTLFELVYEVFTSSSLDELSSNDFKYLIDIIPSYDYSNLVKNILNFIDISKLEDIENINEIDDEYYEYVISNLLINKTFNHNSMKAICININKKFIDIKSTLTTIYEIIKINKIRNELVFDLLKYTVFNKYGKSNILLTESNNLIMDIFKYNNIDIIKLLKIKNITIEEFLLSSKNLNNIIDIIEILNINNIRIVNDNVIDICINFIRDNRYIKDNNILFRLMKISSKKLLNEYFNTFDIGDIENYIIPIINELNLKDNNKFYDRLYSSKVNNIQFDNVIYNIKDINYIIMYYKSSISDINDIFLYDVLKYIYESDLLLNNSFKMFLMEKYI